MPDVLISQLPPAASALSRNDLFEIEQGSDPSNTSGYASLGEIADFAAREGFENRENFKSSSADIVLSATYTLGGVIRRDRATAQTLTVPTYDEFDPWVKRGWVEVVQDGDGELTIVADPGVTIRSFGSSLTLKGKHARAYLVWRSDIDDNTWDLFGDLLVAPPADPALTVTEVSVLGGDLELDFSLGKTFTVTLTESVAALILTNVAAAGIVTEFDLLITQDVSGVHTFDLPGNFLAIGGSDTAIAAGAGEKTLLTAKTFDGGTTWLYAMQDIEVGGA